MTRRTTSVQTVAFQSLDVTTVMEYKGSTDAR